MNETVGQTCHVRLSDIIVPPKRLRALRCGVVAQLADSMKAQRQLQPIVLRPSEASGYYLVAGMHRLAAAKTLQWESIWATVLEGLNADLAALAEIDENLARADLSPAERAAHQHARKELYERLHPQTRKGSAGGRAKSANSQGAKDQVDTWHPAYIDDAAKKSGRSRASISRETNRSKSIPDVADLAGTSLDKGTELDALGRLPSDVREQLAAEAKAGKKVSAKATLKKVQRAQKEIDLGFKQAALPQKRYGVIVADPEWSFEPWSQETGMDRAADNHYPTSPTEVIAGRPVASIAADDCVLFLWATVPMLPQALRVMAAWGFEYKTNFIWAKDRIGTGYWNRNKHELLLVGVRGKPPAPAPGTQSESVLHAPVGRHSAKPELFLELIERYFPTLPKIELNRRGLARPGWDAWGNEATSVQCADRRDTPSSPFAASPHEGALGRSRKNRTISRLASGPLGSVYDPAALPPDQA